MTRLRGLPLVVIALLFGGFFCLGPEDIPEPNLELSGTYPAPDIRPPEPVRRSPTIAYDELARKTQDEIRAIKPLVIPVLTLNGEVFPFPDDQFTRIAPDKCGAWHYHGSVGFSLALKKVPEPDDPCGFGTDVSEQEVDAEALIHWFWNGPKAQR